MKSVYKIIKVILVVLFVGCLFDMPYGYFQLIRFLGMAGFGILSFYEYKVNQGWFITWLASAILINPVFKISLGRAIWNIVDVTWVVLLIVSIFINQKEEAK